MTYSGAPQVATARQNLGAALQVLQSDPNIPQDVMAVAQNLAQAMGALFTAEQATDEVVGKQNVRAALGSLSQTLALLQDVRSAHPGIATATEALARVMSILFPLTSVPTRAPPPGTAMPQVQIPQAAAVPQGFGGSSPSRAPLPMSSGPRVNFEANIGATTESNFFVGFSGEIAEGGVFIATYTAATRGQGATVVITLPGGFETKINGVVRFVRDSLDMSQDSEPGVGVQFEALAPDVRELILRFIRKRAPMFYDE